MLAITHAELVMRDHLIPDAALLVKDGRIADFGEMRSVRIPEGCGRLDVAGAYVAPGMIDIHTHSGGGKYFYEDPAAACRHYLRHGTTTVLAALYFNLDQARYLRAIDTVRGAMGTPECANLGGIYMEGPYMNPGFGCERSGNPWEGPIRREDYQPIIDRCGHDVRVWALAPEREGILGFVRDAKAANPEAVFAVAHSAASPQEVEALMPYGLRIGTHHTNATGDRPRYPECRGVCVDEAVNYNSNIYAELICDSRGIHVDPYMLRLVRKIKGEGRIVLITDAFDSDGPVPPGYDGVADINFDGSGEIAGTKLTLDQACRNMMKHTGASIVDVFRYVAYNPAEVLGLKDRGEIAVGLRADLVVVDHKINVQTVLLEGVVQS